jgi:hypothetical protein
MATPYPSTSPANGDGPPARAIARASWIVAAIQVAVPRRLLVLDIADEGEPRAMG